MKKVNLLLIALLYMAIAARSQTPKLLVLALDGTRPDALQLANTPHIDDLMSNGVYSYDAYTRFPTKTKPGWSSLYTGVWKEQHHVLSNDATGNNLERFPYFIKHLKRSNPALEAVWITGNGQSTIQDHVSEYIDLQFFDYMDDTKKDLAIDLLTNQDPDVLILHLGFIDFHGHVYSFSPNTPQYIDAIELADSQIGEVMAAITNRPNYASEDWLIIGASDHGGNGLNHGGSTIADRNIIFFASGGNVPNQQIQAKENFRELANVPFFNGNDNYLSLPYQSGSAYNQNEDFSIECSVWITDTVHKQFIMSNQDGVNPLARGFSLSVNPQIDEQLVVNISDGYSNVYLNGPAITDGNPHHISVTFDRKEFMTLYIDGYMYNAKKIDHLDDIHSLNDLVIGQSGALNANHYYKGAIADVRVWKGVLKEETIATYACYAVNSAHPLYHKMEIQLPLNSSNGMTFQNAGNMALAAVLSGSILQWGSMNAKTRCLNYNYTPRIVDGAPTILNHFCVPINPYWEIQGRAWTNNAQCTYDTCITITATGATDITFNSARLTWSATSTPDHFILRGKRPDDPRFRYFRISNPQDTSFVVTKLRPNTYYIWQIQAVCDTNDLVFSEFTPLDTVRTLECTEPEELTVDSITNSSARLSWNQNNRASFYRLLGFSDLPEAAIMDFVLTGSTNTEMNMTNLSSGSEYYWKVRSECGVGYYSNYSKPDTFVTLTAKQSNNLVDPGAIEEEKIVIYPNPLHSKSRISFNNPDGEAYRLVITDATGAMVREVDGIRSEAFVLKRGQLASGVYQLELKGRVHKSAKLMVR